MFKEFSGRWLIYVTIVYVVGVMLYLFKAFSSPLVFGIDGPYYVVQVSSILSGRGLVYLDPPLAFYMLALFSVVLGNVFAGVKVGSVVLTLLTVYPLYGLVSRITGCRMCGLISCVLFVLNGFLVRMLFDFIKNAIGLLFLTLSLFFYYEWLISGKGRYCLLACIVTVVTGLTHILDFGVLVLTYTLTSIVVLIGFRSHLNITRTLPLLMVSYGLLGVGFISYTLMGGDPYKFFSFTAKLLGVSESLFEVDLGVLKTATPLIIGLAGILVSRRYSGLGRVIVLSTSLVLVLLNLPFIPHQYLWRFNLMSALLLPLSMGFILGLVRDNYVVLLLGLAVAGLMFQYFGLQMVFARPSIPLGEYEELKMLLDRVPENTVIVVPDTRLRYWVQTFRVEGVYGKVSDVPANMGILILFDKGPFLGRRPPSPPIPPRARLFYDGEYVTAYLLPPRPP